MMSERTKLSDKPWWLMTPGEDKIEDAKFALRCAETFAEGLSRMKYSSDVSDSEQLSEDGE